MLARLTQLACVGALTVAGTAAVAAPAQAATTTPLACNTVVAPNDPTLSVLLGLLGVTAPNQNAVGINCSAPTTTTPVNYCGTTIIDGGLVVFGNVPGEGDCP